MTNDFIGVLVAGQVRNIRVCHAAVLKIKLQ
jgi:hypothetical protein